MSKNNKKVRVGLLVYSSQTGLGYQTLALARMLKPYKIMHVDLSMYNQFPVNPDVYNDLCTYKRDVVGTPRDDDFAWLATDVDVVFICETPINWNGLNVIRAKGAKSVIQYNYEFLNYYRQPNLPKPDLLLSPSDWYINKVRRDNFAPVVLLRPPLVDFEAFKGSDKLKARKRLNASVHIQGRPTLGDRNGTKTFLDVVEVIEKRKRLKLEYYVYGQLPNAQDRTTWQVYGQYKDQLDRFRTSKQLEGRFKYYVNTPKQTTMYAKGEVLVLPRKYGGLCLPMNEALASAMPTVMPDITPNRQFLPKEWLVPAKKAGYITTHSPIPFCEVDPKDVVAVVDNIRRNIKKHASMALELAQNFNATKLRKKYIDVFLNLLNNKYD